MLRPALIIGSEPRVVIAVARSLASHGIPVHAGNFPPEPLRLRSRAIQRVIGLPRPDLEEGALARELVQLIERWGYDIVFPCNDSALSTLLRVHGELRKAVHLACPPPATLRKVLDKQATLDIAARCGIPVPRQWRIGTVSELESLVGEIAFPLVAKPASKRAAAAFKVRYIKDAAELRDALSADPSFGAAHLLQEYCPGHGVGVEVLLHEGDPIVLFQHRRLKEYPATGGVSVAAAGEPVDRRLAEYALLLLRELEWSGIAMVEFRRDPASGATALMEVNGRFWGSLALSRRAGLEFPLYQWQLAHGQQPVPPAECRTGVKFHWLVGDLRRAMDLAREHATSPPERLRRTWAELLLVNRERRVSSDALWLWSDPLPAAIELTRFVAETVRSECVSALRAVLLGGPAGRMRRYFVRQRQARGLGLIERLEPQDLRRLRRVVFVCHGNIMRSALAEGIVTSLLMPGAGHHVSSAGLFARAGMPADERAVSFAADRGVDIKSHRSKPLDRQLATAADMIFVMDYENAIRLLTQMPEVRGRVALLSAVLGRRSGAGKEILDPYRGAPNQVKSLLREVEGCAQLLAQSWLSESSGSVDRQHSVS